jgi:protease-4
MFNSTEPFTPDQRKVLALAFKRTYDQFIDRVKSGRTKLKDVDAVARGRLFTGRQAVDNGMADKLGGVDTAVLDMAAETGLAPGSYDVVDLPGPLSFQEFLQHYLGGMAAADGKPDQAAAQMMILEMAHVAMGDQAWQSAEPVLRGMLLMRSEPVLMLMPEAIVVK